MTAPPFDVARAHRWFAIELNNEAWNLVEKEQLTAAERERMIHAAHGACLHWMEVGELLNQLRAQNLLATAYAKAGLAEAAVRYAEKCLALSAQAADQQTPFDRATVHGCAAAAYQLAGRTAAAQQAFDQAVAAAAALTDPEDRAVFEKLYPSR